MAAAIEFYEDINGTRPLSKDFGIAIIGKERTIYMKNIGDTYLKEVNIEVDFLYMKGLQIPDIAPGEIKPAIKWNPPNGMEEQPFEGNITVKAISYRK